MSAFLYSSKSAEPPPPYPPPQSFITLTSESVKSQVGLLRSYFEHRLASAGLDTLPDDLPSPAQAKLGPLGQVLRPSNAAIAAAAGSKKKAKPKDAAVAAATAAATASAPAPTVSTPAAVTAGSTAPGVTVGVITGVVAGVVQQPMTPVLSSPSVMSQLGGSASVIPSATPTMATAVVSTGELQPQPQTPKKKKAAPGAGAGAGTGAGSAGAGTGGGPSGGGTNKKRGRPPEGLPPVVLASA